VNAELIARIVVLILFAIGGIELGEQLRLLLPELNAYALWLKIGSSVILALLGALTAPWFTIRPFHKLQKIIKQTPAPTLWSGIIGLFIGLALGAVAAYPISLLPGGLGRILPFISAVIFGYLGVLVMTTRTELLGTLRSRFVHQSGGKEAKKQPTMPPIFLDTSVIIDGRIADIARTGFIQGELVVPLFVLNELQHIADSADTLRRNRGRRGLEILRQLQEEAPVPVRITNEDAPSVREVDDKLISLAREHGGSILTNDYNLNRVAELQGIQVLNVNELANAVKTLLLPGETFTIHVLQEGKEYDQGVGYLDDGTMVVVEGGRPYIGKTIEVIVNKVLQTAAGRMIFARPVS